MLVEKIKYGAFTDFQAVFSECSNPHSDFWGVDPERAWKLSGK